MNSLLEWARNNAVAFDTTKSEVIHFPAHKGESPVEIQVNSVRIEPAEHIRWLGIYLDPQLTFKHHVTAWCGKALKIAQHLRRLNSVKRGAAPKALIAAVDACVVPVATFGAEVWWPGMKRLTRRGITTPQTSHICSLIDKVIHLALRAALPV